MAKAGSGRKDAAKAEDVSESADGLRIVSLHAGYETEGVYTNAREQPAPTGDAELVRAYAEYRKLVDEANAGGHRNADGDISDDAAERIGELGRQIWAHPAKTLEGATVKLRAAAYWITADKRDELQDRCVLTALETFERLIGRAS